MKFDWDSAKDAINFLKHGVDFQTAKLAFNDSNRVLLPDRKHSQKEGRFFCFGMVNGKVITVRFVLRDGVIRIIGAGEWRRGTKIYEKNQKN